MCIIFFWYFSENKKVSQWFPDDMFFWAQILTFDFLFSKELKTQVNSKWSSPDLSEDFQNFHQRSVEHFGHHIFDKIDFPRHTTSVSVLAPFQTEQTQTRYTRKHCCEGWSESACSKKIQKYFRAKGEIFHFFLEKPSKSLTRSDENQMFVFFPTRKKKLRFQKTKWSPRRDASSLSHNWTTKKKRKVPISNTKKKQWKKKRVSFWQIHLGWLGGWTF